MSVNKVILIGNIGQDPEIRTSSNGQEIATFSLATTESWKDKNTGEKKDKTEWHRIVIFSQGLVGIVKNYVKKGSKVYVEGSLHTRNYEKNGEKHYVTEIVLQNFNSTLQILDSKNAPTHFQEKNENDDWREKVGLKKNGEVEQIDDEVPF